VWSCIQTHCVSRLYTMRRYDIYDIGPPYLWYNITIDILEFGGVEEEVQGGRVVFDVHWNPVASVVISPEALLRRSDDGKVCGLTCVVWL